MAKLKREAHGMYIRFQALDAWYLIGKGISDMSVTMNGSFEQTKDITGEVAVADTGYQPQTSVEPYYADPDDAIYEHLLDLALNRKSGDDAKAEYMEVVIEDPEDSEHKAWQENCRVEIVSYGGDTSGLQIAFNIWPDGGRKTGKATFEGKVPTFAE
mgnify:CR=1 FL=1